MNLHDLLLGKERILVIKGKKVPVRELERNIFIDREGHFILPRWKGVEMGQTPHQRKQKKWNQKELGYVVHLQGLSSALRSRQLALLQAEKNYLPTYQTALKIFTEEIRERIIKDKSVDLKKIPYSLRNQLLQFGFIFQRAQKAGVKEALVKILFLFQDKEAGLSVGAMLARTMAITDRFRERLIGIYSWVRKFSAQEKILHYVDFLIVRVIQSASEKTRILKKRIAVLEGYGGKREQKLVADQLKSLSLDLGPLQQVMPFSRWISFFLRDIDETLEAIEKEDFILARSILEKIIFSLKLRNIKKSLDRLLLRVGQDKIANILNWPNYEIWTKSLSGQLSMLIQQEKLVGLRDPVCQKTSDVLREAAIEAASLKRVGKFKERVKGAYSLL